MAGSNNAIGSNNVNQTIGKIEAESLGALESTLRDEGVTEDQLAELRDALNQDHDSEPGTLGQRVRAWLAATLKDASVASAPIITTAVMAYLGLPAGA